MNSLVSIIVPSYKKAEFIGETINSVQNQTYKNWELIIIDDNSTDNSWELIKNNSNQDKRIRCFKNDSGKKGGSICRNIRIRKIERRIFGFLVQEFNFEEMANRIIELLLDKNLRDELGKNGRTNIINLCSEENRLKSIVQILKR